MGIKAKKESFQCDNCGANEFTYQFQTAICEYCNTIFTLQDVVPVEGKLSANQYASHRDSKRGIRTTARIIGSIVVAFVALGIILAIIGHNRAMNSISHLEFTVIPPPIEHVIPLDPIISSPILQIAESGLEHIDSVGLWTREIYDDIRVAHKEIVDGRHVYSNGSTFASVLELVGRPQITSYFSFGKNTEITATWETGVIPENFVSVFIIYDKATDYIIQKNVSSFSNLHDGATITPGKLGLMNIDLVEGWTAERFEDIEVATRHWGDFQGDSTFTDGDDFFELEAIVGRAPQVFPNEDGTSTATWRGDRNNLHVSISITFEQATGMITSRNIYAGRW